MKTIYTILKPHSPALATALPAIFPKPYGAGLYQSGNLLDSPDEEVAALVARLEIRAVFNLWSKPDKRLQDLTSYFHRPIPDGKYPDLAALEEVTQSATSYLRYGSHVLIQCHAGRERSSLLSALVLRQFLRITGAQAVEMVRLGRPRALDNPAFYKALVELGLP